MPYGESVSSVMRSGLTGSKLNSGRGGNVLDGIGPKMDLAMSRTLGGSTLPTTTRTALLGTYQVLWKFRRSAPVVLSNDGRVPRPECSYGVPLNVAARSCS